MISEYLKNEKTLEERHPVLTTLAYLGMVAVSAAFGVWMAVLASH